MSTSYPGFTPKSVDWCNNFLCEKGYTTYDQKMFDKLKKNEKDGTEFKECVEKIFPTRKEVLECENIIKIHLTEEQTLLLGNGIKTLEFKHFVNMITKDTCADKMTRVRTIVSFKLPTEVWPDGYIDAVGNKRYWVNIYRSSGLNSKSEGAWHPLLGILKKRRKTESENDITYILKNYYLPYAENILREEYSTFEKNVHQGEYFLWWVKCASYGMFVPILSDLEKKADPKKVAKLKLRIANIYRTLYGPIKNYPLTQNNKYYCNTFWEKLCQVMKSVCKINKDTIIFNESISVTIPFIEEKCKGGKLGQKEDYYINHVIGENNVFGVYLNTEKIDPKMYNLYKNIQKISESNLMWKDTTEQIKEYFEDGFYIKTISELLETILDTI